MNKSINTKLFLWFCLLIVLVIFFIWLLNTLVLEKYYLYKKQNTLVSIYKTINSFNTDLNTEESLVKLDLELEKLESIKNIDIVIRNGTNITIYTTSRDFIRDNKIIPHNSNSAIGNDPENNMYNISRLEKGQKFLTEVFYDERVNAEFISLLGILDNNFYVFIRTPLESIRESVEVSNRFLIFVGLLAIFFSSILSLFISKTFTKPITELNSIAKNMSNLDFSKRYISTSDDEIGMLGNSINKLSDNLEETITELTKANIDLEKDVEETSKLSEMREQFISDVSHELKTPIALIQGYAEGLLDNVVTDEANKKYYCEVILDEANRMSELTKDLLDLSQLEYGNNELQITSFDIVDLISCILKKNEVLFSEKQIKAEFINTKSILVEGDIFRIEQVLINYISNAFKHIDDNKILKIYIQEKENNIIRICVFNSGNSIEEENLTRIWGRFYKVDPSRNRENGGTGLGLSLVKAIMLKHNKNCGVQNIDNGVEFWFELKKSI